VRFVPFARHRYRILTVDVTGRAPEAVPGRRCRRRRRRFVRILLTGETDETGVDLPALRQALEGRFYSLELRDETRLPGYLGPGGGGLPAGPLSAGAAGPLAPDAAARGAGAHPRAVRFGLAALDRRDLG
jgi:hypothetical protein